MKRRYNINGFVGDLPQLPLPPLSSGTTDGQNRVNHACAAIPGVADHSLTPIALYTFLLTISKGTSRRWRVKRTLLSLSFYCVNLP